VQSLRRRRAPCGRKRSCRWHLRAPPANPIACRSPTATRRSQVRSEFL